MILRKYTVIPEAQSELCQTSKIMELFAEIEIRKDIVIRPFL